MFLGIGDLAGVHDVGCAHSADPTGLRLGPMRIEHLLASSPAGAGNRLQLRRVGQGYRLVIRRLGPSAARRGRDRRGAHISDLPQQRVLLPAGAFEGILLQLRGKLPLPVVDLHQPLLRQSRRISVPESGRKSVLVLDRRLSLRRGAGDRGIAEPGSLGDLRVAEGRGIVGLGLAAGGCDFSAWPRQHWVVSGPRRPKSLTHPGLASTQRGLFGFPGPVLPGTKEQACTVE